MNATTTNTTQELSQKEKARAASNAYKKTHKEEIRAYNKAYQEANKERLAAQREVYQEANKEKKSSYTKSYTKRNKAKLKEYNKAYRQANKERLKSQEKAYREANKERINAGCKSWRQANKEVAASCSRAWHINRTKSDPLFRAKAYLRSAVKTAFNRIKQNKPTDTQTLLGCTWEEAKAHFESLFQEGMSWENHGEWHIDHIRPVASFAQDELYLMNHISNLQPLWAKDNLQKSDDYL